MQAFKTDGQGQ